MWAGLDLDACGLLLADFLGLTGCPVLVIREEILEGEVIMIQD